MVLGIVVATDRNLELVCGIAAAAAARGHAVRIFVTGDGARLLAQERLGALAALPGTSVVYCDHSARRCGVDTGRLARGLARGSQLDNAVICTESDKVLVL